MGGKEIFIWGPLLNMFVWVLVLLWIVVLALGKTELILSSVLSRFAENGEVWMSRAPAARKIHMQITIEYDWA